MQGKHEQRIENLESRFNRLEPKVDRILSLLENDLATGRTGIGQELVNLGLDVKELDMRVRNIETALKITTAKHLTKKGFWALIGGLIVAGVSMADDLITFIKTIFKS